MSPKPRSSRRHYPLVVRYLAPARQSYQKVRRHRGMKRLFNKRVRRMGIDDVPSFGAYRKANKTLDDDGWRAVRHTLSDYEAMLRRFGVRMDGDELACAYRRAFLAK